MKDIIQFINESSFKKLTENEVFDKLKNSKDGIYVIGAGTDEFFIYIIKDNNFVKLSDDELKEIKKDKDKDKYKDWEHDITKDHGYYIGYIKSEYSEGRANLNETLPILSKKYGEVNLCDVSYRDFSRDYREEDKMSTNRLKHLIKINMKIYNL